MFYQAEPDPSLSEASVDIVVDNHEHPIVAVEDVSTINPSIPSILPISHTLRVIDPNVIVIDGTQPTSTNAIENTSAGSTTTPSRKRTR